MPDPRAAAKMTEADLDRQVRRILASLPAVLGYHTHNSERSHPGFPDWVFAGPRGVLWRELKRENGTVTAAQKCWLDALREAGGNAAVWRPSDLLCGDIARQLAALAAMGADHLGHPLAPVPQAHRAALTGVRWPDLPSDREDHP